MMTFLLNAFSDAGGQGGVGAIFVAVYKRSSNTYFLYNVGTGIISYFMLFRRNGLQMFWRFAEANDCRYDCASGPISSP